MNEPLEITELIPTQNGFRMDLSARKAMYRFVNEGGVFSLDQIRLHTKHPGLIALAEFEDGKRYIRDGLHRATAIYVARDSGLLYPEEYFVEHYTYERWLSAHPENGWYTPFDPRTEVRLANFFDFKDEVLAMIAQGLDPCDFILHNRHRYSIPRTEDHTFESLASQFLPIEWPFTFEEMAAIAKNNPPPSWVCDLPEECPF